MTMVTEPERLELHQAMRGLVGTGPANTLMELATPRDWDQVVRTHHLTLAVDGLRSDVQRDLADLRAELKQDIADLRAELKQDINDLRTELKKDMVELRMELKQDINDLRLELTEEIANLRTELKQDINDLRTEVISRISTELQTLSRWIIGVLTTLSVSLIVAVVR